MERQTQDPFQPKISELLKEWCETLNEISADNAAVFTNQNILDVLAGSRQVHRAVLKMEVELNMLRHRSKSPSQTMTDIKNALQAEGSNVTLFPIVPRDNHPNHTPKGAA